nr:unnamed protein product [Digitaria exilis]
MDAGGEKCGGDAAGEAGSDLYAVLGLKKECSDAELKVAYRKLAMRWHPDKCSSSNSVKHMEEAKEKFQEIQSAYSVLSDANKRFLYDVGVYNDEDNEDSLQGMSDFIGEMAQMMSQARPTRQESFEELQQLFVDMFQSDLDSGFCNGPTKATLSFHIVLQMSDTKQAPKARGQNTSRRRNGRKQKLSSKHDVSSEDDTAGSQLQQHVAV